MPHSVTFNTYCFKLAYCAFKDTRVLYIDWNFLVLKTDHMLNDRKLFPILRQSYMNSNIQPFLQQMVVERKPMNHTLIFQILNFQNTSALPQLF